MKNQLTRIEKLEQRHSGANECVFVHLYDPNRQEKIDQARKKAKGHALNIVTFSGGFGYLPMEEKDDG